MRKYQECLANISLFTSYPNERRYWMVKIAVVRVFPSLKAWIRQMPEMNLAICSIFSSTVRPLWKVLLLLNIPIQGSSQVFQIQVVYGISFNISLSHIYEICRWLQLIYSLQSDSRLPVLCTFLLRRLSLSEILVEGCKVLRYYLYS